MIALREGAAGLHGIDAPKSAQRSRAGGETDPWRGCVRSCTDNKPVQPGRVRANRWDIDTGAGRARLNRLSRVEVNAPELHTWTFDIDEPC